MIGSNAANESDPARDALDPAILDRLVDGELAEADRREAVAKPLEHQPTGWRQCALAFLEAQSWRDLLGVAAETTETVTETPAEPAEALLAATPAVRGLPWLAAALALGGGNGGRLSRRLFVGSMDSRRIGDDNNRTTADRFGSRRSRPDGQRGINTNCRNGRGRGRWKNRKNASSAGRR